MATIAFAQSDYQDVVYLKNGTVIRGIIVEQVPNESLKIETANGSIFVFKIDEIEKYGKDVTGKKAEATTTTPAEIQQQTAANQQYAGNSYPNPNYIPKKPGLSWLFSFLIPGAGQFYNGDIGKGVGFLGAYILGAAIMTTNSETKREYLGNGWYKEWTELDPAMAAVGIPIVLGAWIWAQIDAYNGATTKNRANGYFSWNLGKGSTNLALQPEFKLTSAPVNQSIVYTPTCGMALKLNF